MRGRWFVAVRAVTLVMMVVTTCFGTGAWAEDPPAKLAGPDLDTLVGPIALYPDPILAQVLTASTFEDQVIAANKWAVAHKGLEGDALAKAMEEAKFTWDASVQALVPFPSVLETLTGDPKQLTKLGDAVLVQRGDVMEAVQRMRKKAQDYGNLKSSEQLTVTTEDKQYIVIQPANPEVIYVPVYQPAVVYAPPPPTGAVMFGFIAGVAVASMYSNNWYGGCGFYWHSSTVVIHNSAWGRTYYNQGSYRPPYGGGPTYVHNTNVNINTGNTNINTGNINTGNVNSGNRASAGNTSANAAKTNADRAAVSGGATAKTTPSASTQRPSTSPAPSASTQRPTTSPGSSSRGYTQSPSANSSSAFGGSQNGRSESVASSRGHASSGGGGGASRGGGGGGRRR